MKLIKTDCLNAIQKQALLACWNEVYPASLCYTSLDEMDMYFSKLSNVEFFLLEYDDLNATAFAYRFLRDKETWLTMLMPATLQRKGNGKVLLDVLKSGCVELNAWVVDHNHALMKNEYVYISPLWFYLQNDFAIVENVRLETEVISALKLRWKKSD